MSNLQQVDWQTIRAASVVGLAGSYVVLPTFSYAAPFIGASEIVVQFGYTVARKFTLKSLPEKPADATYCLCVRYRVGETVFRYKLWDSVGEVMTGVELYNGQLIRQNFVFEVWNTANSATQVNAAEVTLLTSLGSIPTDYRNVAATSASSSTLIYPLAQDNNYPLVTTDLILHLRADDIVDPAQWIDNINSNIFVPQLGQPVLRMDTLNGYNTFEFNDIDISLLQGGLIPSYDPISVFMFVKPTNLAASAAGSSFLTISDASTTKYSGVKVSSVAGEIVAYNDVSDSSSGVEMTQDIWQVLRFNHDYTGSDTRSVRTCVDDYAFTPVLGTKKPLPNIMTIGKLGSSASFYVSEVLVYNTLSVDADAVKRYLNAKFGVAIALPIVFPDGSAWDDNNV